MDKNKSTGRYFRRADLWNIEKSVNEDEWPEEFN